MAYPMRVPGSTRLTWDILALRDTTGYSFALSAGLAGVEPVDYGTGPHEIEVGFGQAKDGG